MFWQNNVLQMRLHLIVSPNFSDDFNESSCVSKKKKTSEIEIFGSKAIFSRRQCPNKVKQGFYLSVLLKLKTKP